MYTEILLTVKYFLPNLWVVSVFLAGLWFIGMFLFLMVVFVRTRTLRWRYAAWLLLLPFLTLAGVTLLLMALITLLSFLPGWHDAILNVAL